MSEDRRNLILDRVISGGFVAVDELAAGLSVSRMTIHRDLNLLSARGLVRKERGGVSAERSLLVESNFHFRQHQMLTVKRAIAAAAADLIEPGMVVFIDDSTTALQMVPAIRKKGPLTVATNSLPVVLALEDADDIDLCALGGRYDRSFQACLGIGCERAISALRANLAFMSTSAIDGLVAFHQNEQVVRAKLAMMESAARNVLLVDHTKFERNALNRFSSLVDFDRIFVDDGLKADLAAALAEKLNLTSVTTQ